MNIDTRNEIEAGAARALFLLDYADGVEDLPCAECGQPEDDCRFMKCGKGPYVQRIEGEGPGAGGDWDDVAPETTLAAKAEARALVFDVGERYDLTAIVARWVADTRLDAERFGHCLAMRAAGTGVGLIDDLPAGIDAAYLPREVPSVETYGLAEES